MTHCFHGMVYHDLLMDYDISIYTCKYLLTLAMPALTADDRPKFFNFFCRNFRNSNFNYRIWIQHEKLIEMSTNKPSIGAVVLDIVA